MGEFGERLGRQRPKLYLITGGRPEKGAAVSVNGRPATVIQSAFSSPEFSEDVALRYENGDLDLVALDLLDHQKTPTSRPQGNPGGRPGEHSP